MLGLVSVVKGSWILPHDKAFEIQLNVTEKMNFKCYLRAINDW